MTNVDDVNMGLLLDALKKENEELEILNKKLSAPHKYHKEISMCSETLMTLKRFDRRIEDIIESFEDIREKLTYYDRY